MPETLEKPGKTKRKGWTQAHVAELVRAHGLGVMVGQDLLPFSSDERHAKLVSLGFVAKPERPVLNEEVQLEVDGMIFSLTRLPEPQQPLAIRYAIKSLQALLPKRAPK